MKSELLGVAAKWRGIGGGLRLRAAVLDTIQEANQGDPEECLSRVVLEWLRKNYNTERFGEPTWQGLVEVVATPAGGNNNDLAAKIASKHQGEETNTWLLQIIVRLLVYTAKYDSSHIHIHGNVMIIE